jgi:hypothetical protein
MEMKKAVDELENELHENRLFAKKMENTQVLVIDYIRFWYGDKHGAKAKFARDQGVSSQQVNSWLKKNCYIENKQIKHPDPNPIALIKPSWIKSYFI